MKTLQAVTLLAFTMVATPVVYGQASHPSENYPGKGGNQDATNAAPLSPEQQNPSTGTQTVPTTPPQKSQQ